MISISLIEATNGRLSLRFEYSNYNSLYHVLFHLVRQSSIHTGEQLVANPVNVHE